MLDLPEGSGGWGGLTAGAAAALIILRRLLSGQSVDLAGNKAQVNIIATLQVERDAAVKRADEAVAAREAALTQFGAFQLQIAQLQTKIEQLTEQVASLRNIGTLSAQA